MIKILLRLGMAALLPVASPALAQDCFDCHAEVAKQLKGNSHHIQGVTASAKHCYACHWEATIDGQINELYHSAKRNAPVHLVLWSTGQRPTAYRLNETALLFSPSDISTTKERATVALITRHCLGCHSDQNNDIRPFTGDNGTPRRYAWDRQSVASLYSNKAVATWGKYSTGTTNKKQRIIKSFSAHGNAAANHGGWSTSSGYDTDIPITRGGSGAQNIECFDCHNSHGSTVSGITSSYPSLDGNFNGGILKQTQSGKGGYQTTYSPSGNLNSHSKNPYNAGAGLCFDCHETPREGTTPWGYNSTFSAGQPIIGYRDTHRFGSGSKGSTARYQNRQSHIEISSSHFKSGKFLNYSAHGQINGLCTPCHDPHGVSRTLGDIMPYALPLLKGSWMTSPYREDGPPSGMPKIGGLARQTVASNQGKMLENDLLNITNNSSPLSGGGSLRAPIPGLQYNIDRNTLGSNNRIVENDDKFGGLCFKCHPAEKIKSIEVHRAVKGWGNNKEHSFPCSKCHQAHNSGLPRLMQTNCFVAGPQGLRDSNGLPWTPKKSGVPLPSGNSSKSAIVQKGSQNNKVVKKEIVGCHVKQFGGGSASPKTQEAQPWKKKNAW